MVTKGQTELKGYKVKGYKRSATNNRLTTAPEAYYLNIFLNCIKGQQCLEAKCVKHGRACGYLEFCSALGIYICADCLMASFTWWHRGDILKRWSDREAIVYLMSPHFLPPPPQPSYLTFPSGLVAHLCCLFGSQALLSSIKWHIHATLSLFYFFLTSIFTPTNEMWDKCKLFIWLHLTWRFTFLSKARQFNSIISLSKCCCYPPWQWKWGVFTLLGRIEGLAMSRWV